MMAHREDLLKRQSVAKLAAHHAHLKLCAAEHVSVQLCRHLSLVAQQSPCQTWLWPLLCSVWVHLGSWLMLEADLGAQRHSSSCCALADALADDSQMYGNHTSLRLHA